MIIHGIEGKIYFVYKRKKVSTLNEIDLFPVMLNRLKIEGLVSAGSTETTDQSTSM